MKIKKIITIQKRSRGMSKKLFTKNLQIVCMVSAISTVVFLGSQLNNVIAKDLPESLKVENNNGKGNKKEYA